MTISTTKETDETKLSPQVARILKLAAIEAASDWSGRGDAICAEHLIIAILQDADPRSLAYDLLRRCNLTVSDIRNGVSMPKFAPASQQQ